MYSPAMRPPLYVVRDYEGLDLAALDADVEDEHGDFRLVRHRDGVRAGVRIPGRQQDGLDFPLRQVLDIRELPRRVGARIHDDHVYPKFRGLRLDAIGDGDPILIAEILHRVAEHGLFLGECAGGHQSQYSQENHCSFHLRPSSLDILNPLRGYINIAA